MLKQRSTGVFGMPRRYRKNQNRDAYKQAKTRSCNQDKGFGVLRCLENHRAFIGISRARTFKNYQEVFLGLRKLAKSERPSHNCAGAKNATRGGFPIKLSAITLCRNA